MTKKSKMILALASMLGVSAGATAVSGFAWFITTKSATIEITNIGVYSSSSGLDVRLNTTKTLKGVTQAASPATGHSFDLVGATVSKTETLTATEANQVAFTLSKYASEITSVTVGSNALSADDYTFTPGTAKASKTLTLDDGVASGTKVTVVYTAYEALTDISSTDGQTFYKPTWTAGNPGLYATAMPTVTDGYVQFTMTLTASGSDSLDIYLNGASIAAAISGTENAAAADIARVAFFEKVNNVDTTVLVAQNAVNDTNNKGIDASFVKNSDSTNPASGTNYDQWDLSKLGSTNVPAKLAEFDDDDKNTWSTGDKTKEQNYITTVPGLSSKDITVSIWLEGTSGNTGGKGSGEFAAENLENAMISVNLPLIAFNAVA